MAKSVHDGYLDWTESVPRVRLYIVISAGIANRAWDLPTGYAGAAVNKPLPRLVSGDCDPILIVPDSAYIGRNLEIILTIPFRAASRRAIVCSMPSVCLTKLT